MSTYEISKSSLLSLKTEILKKRQEIVKAKAENEVKIKSLRKNTPLELKNKNIEERQKKDIAEEDEDILKKSRSVLEAKALLYDKLSKGSIKLTAEEEEYNRRYLVRFDRKLKKSNLPPESDNSENDTDRHPSDDEKDVPNTYEAAKSPDEEWVEYVDCLGRTRTCMKKDLDYLKSKDKDLKVVVDSRNRGESVVTEQLPTKSPPPKPQLTEENELLSSDMRRELMRQQWEKEEEGLKNKTDIHYQDILFNEARTHGVGYYAFSVKEEERAKQQEALRKLREETKQKQSRAQEAKAKRDKQLAARVKAAKNRRRARLGLPPEDEDEPEMPEDNKQNENTEENLEKERKQNDEERKKHLRPWDIGKKGVKEHYEYTQEEWVDKKRKERPEEFAPPKEFSRSFRSERKSPENKNEGTTTSNSLRFTSKKTKPQLIKNKFECSDIEDHLNISRNKGAEIAPPPTYEYYGPGRSSSSRKRPFNEEIVDESIEAGLKFIRQQIEKKQTRNYFQDDMFLS